CAVAQASIPTSQRGNCAKKEMNLAPPKPFAQNAFPGRIDAVDLKNVFRQIQPYRLNLAHGWLPSMVRFTDHHSGTDMPRRGPSTWGNRGSELAFRPAADRIQDPPLRWKPSGKMPEPLG